MQQFYGFGTFSALGGRLGALWGLPGGGLESSGSLGLVLGALEGLQGVSWRLGRDVFVFKMAT